jgi:hypothetical protein
MNATQALNALQLLPQSDPEWEFADLLEALSAAYERGVKWIRVEWDGESFTDALYPDYAVRDGFDPKKVSLLPVEKDAIHSFVEFAAADEGDGVCGGAHFDLEQGTFAIRDYYYERVAHTGKHHSGPLLGIEAIVSAPTES